MELRVLEYEDGTRVLQQFVVGDKWTLNKK